MSEQKELAVFTTVEKDNLNKYIDTDNNSADFEPINTLLATSQEVSSLIKKSTTGLFAFPFSLTLE
jgi:hypothetical protein